MQETWCRYLQLKHFFDLPWSLESKKALSKMSDIDPRLGSTTFQQLWSIEKSRSSPKSLLGLILSLLDFPELTGDLAQTRELLARISPELSPDSSFWWDIAEQVDKAFPKDSLLHSGRFARQIHQLRYLISCHQAEYVRQHFRQSNQTDAEGLAAYLKHRSYNLLESARLHNKVMLKDGKVFYPDDSISYNIKIVQNFHTEFILNSSGQFLNELDTEVLAVSGVVNGASFNYAKKNNQRHWELDVLPVRIHDPEFRRSVMREFTAPSLSNYRSFRPLWAKQSYPRLRDVNKAVKRFSRLLKAG